MRAAKQKGETRARRGARARSFIRLFSLRAVLSHEKRYRKRMCTTHSRRLASRGTLSRALLGAGGVQLTPLVAAGGLAVLTPTLLHVINHAHGLLAVGAGLEKHLPVSERKQSEILAGADAGTRVHLVVSERTRRTKRSASGRGNRATNANEANARGRRRPSASPAVWIKSPPSGRVSGFWLAARHEGG
jgi:hypothetical protein